MQKTVFVTLCDSLYFPRTKQTIHDLRTNGKWKGDIVLIAIKLLVPTCFLDQYNIKIVSFPLLDTKFLSILKVEPFTEGDGREWKKLYQWEKFHVFDSFFLQWERVIFLDGGLRIFDSVEYLLSLDCKGKLLAPNDKAHFSSSSPNLFNCQISNDRPYYTSILIKDYSCDILRKEYFLNCIWVYDTDLLKTFTIKEDLIRIMNRYLLCKNNEMTAMNLLFTFKLKVWEPFPERATNGKYLFEWSESNKKEPTTFENYVFLKYPVTI